MTLQEIQDQIQILVDNDTDTPSTTDDEWLVRIGLINQAIRKWEDMDVEWRELWKDYTHSTPITVNTTTYPIAASDFKKIAGYVKLTLNNQVNFVPVINVSDYQAYNNSVKACYVTGNTKDGFILNLGWIPQANDGTVGATISFPYYKYATKFTASSPTTSKTEMMCPSFIIYDVAASKSLLETKNNQYSVYSTEAQNILRDALVQNDIKTPLQPQRLHNTDFINYGAIIGE